VDAWVAKEGVAISALDPLTCERYFDGQLDRYAISTVHHQLNTVRAAYRFGLRHDLVDRDPTTDVILPRLPDIEPVTFTTEELKTILGLTRDDREALLFYLLAFTGMRLSETGALRWKQIDFAARQIKLVGKGAKFRLIPLHPALHRLLVAHRDRNGTHILAGRENRPLAPSTLNNVVFKLTSRAGMTGRKTTSHTFRRTVASQMYEQGIRHLVIDKIMGWAPRTVADRHYIHIVDRTMHDAIRTLYKNDPIVDSPARAEYALESSAVAPLDQLAHDLARLEAKYL
jgi:integrase